MAQRKRKAYVDASVVGCSINKRDQSANTTIATGGLAASKDTYSID